MKRISRFLGAVVLLGAALAAPAAEPANTTGAPRASQEHWQDWQSYLEIPQPNAAKADYLDFVVPPTVFDQAMENLTDLRLRDAKDKEIPYALFVRRAKNNQQPLAARWFNATTSPKHAVSVTLEIQVPQGRHNQLTILTTGQNYRRHVVVESSDDDAKWNPLLERDLISFQADLQSVLVNTFNYPENRRKYVRVTVQPDPGKEDDRPEISSVTIFESVVEKGEDVILPVSLGGRQPTRLDGVNASFWQLDLNKRVPVEQLNVEVAETVFERPYRLEMATAGEPDAAFERWAAPFRTISSGVWMRRLDRQREPLAIRLNETFTRQLRLILGDANNPPLTINSITYQAPARQVVFANTEEIAWPVRIYFGNPNATPPAYDFQQTVTARLEPAPTRLQFFTGEPLRNPIYQAAPEPWTERHPWLVYVVLGIASAVLFAIMALLGKQAWQRPVEPAPVAS